MSQIQEVVTLVLVSILLGASTTTVNADEHISGNDRALTPTITAADQVEPAFLQNGVTLHNDTYAFTMTLPQSDNRFAKLSFSLTKFDRDHTIVPINFNLGETTAFLGTSNKLGNAIVVKDTWIDETGTVWVEFNSPMVAKTILTVVFKTQNPLALDQSVYSIAAYPNTRPAVAVFVDKGTLKT